MIKKKDAERSKNRIGEVLLSYENTGAQKILEQQQGNHC
jgi:hypothetical protein